MDDNYSHSQSSLLFSKKQYFNWKGKTFNQVSNRIKKNAGLKPSASLDYTNLFLPNPLKIYREEIEMNRTLSSHTSSPEFSVQASSSTPPLLQNCNNNILDIKIIKNELSDNITNMNQACNAIIRSRSSSGIIKNIVDNNGIVKIKYCSSASTRIQKINKQPKDVYYPYHPGMIYPPPNSFQLQENNRPYIEKHKGFTNSGAYTAKKNYDKLTKEGFLLRTAKGYTMPNVIAYNIPKEGYIKKDYVHDIPYNCPTEEPLITIPNFEETIGLSTSFLFDKDPIHLSGIKELYEKQGITIVKQGISISFWVYPKDNTGSTCYFNFDCKINEQITRFSFNTTNSPTGPGFYDSYNDFHFPRTQYGKLYHVSFVIRQGTDSNITYYLNGENVGCKITNWSLGTFSGKIGIGNPTIGNANAYYTDVRLYDVILSNLSVISLFNDGYGIFDNVNNDNLLYQYRFYVSDYYMEKNISYIKNWAKGSPSKLGSGFICQHSYQPELILPIIKTPSLFTINNSTIDIEGNQGLSLSFWICPIYNDANISDYYLNFNCMIDTTPAQFSIVTPNASDIDPQLYDHYTNIEFPSTNYNNWYHITITASQGTNSVIIYYINGNIIGGYYSNWPLGKIKGTVEMGNKIHNNMNYSDFRLYNTVLHDNIVNTIYNNGIGAFDNLLFKNILYHYRFYDSDYDKNRIISFVKNWATGSDLNMGYGKIEHII